MKHKILKILAGAVAMSLCSSTYALLWTDTNVHNVKLDADRGPTSLSDSFVIGSGLDWNLYVIDSATATFGFMEEGVSQNGNLGGEEFTIQLGSYLQSYDPGAVFSIDIDIDFGNVGILGELGDDGVIAYTITATSLDFIVTEARLEAEGHQVPDGGVTLSLLGLALAGLAVLRRRFA